MQHMQQGLPWDGARVMGTEAYRQGTSPSLRRKNTFQQRIHQNGFGDNELNIETIKWILRHAPQRTEHCNTDLESDSTPRRTEHGNTETTRVDVLFGVRVVVPRAACAQPGVLGLCWVGCLVGGLLGVGFVVLRPGCARRVLLVCCHLSRLAAGLFGGWLAPLARNPTVEHKRGSAIAGGRARLRRRSATQTGGGMRRCTPAHLQCCCTTSQSFGAVIMQVHTHQMRPKGLGTALSGSVNGRGRNLKIEATLGRGTALRSDGIVDCRTALHLDSERLSQVP